MSTWYQHSAFVVVVVYGPHDVARTTWPLASEAKRYMKGLLQEGVPASSIRLYRTRLVRPSLPSA